MALPHFGQPKASVYYLCKGCNELIPDINKININKTTTDSVFCYRCARKLSLSKLINNHIK